MSMGDGGRMLIWVVAVGVGGYEWTLAVLEVLSQSCSVNWDEDSGRSTGGVGMFVRVLNVMAASVCSTELADTGVSGMKTPGGKVGERRRMYHPRIGRCIDHSTVLVALCCARFSMWHEHTLHELYSFETTYHNIFYDLIVPKEPFLHTGQEKARRRGAGPLTLYQITLSEPSAQTVTRMS